MNFEDKVEIPTGRDCELSAFILGRIGAIAYIHDSQGNIVLASETACRSLGYTEREFRRLPLRKLENGEFDSGQGGPLRNGDAVFETSLVAKDGSLKPCIMRAHRFEKGGRALVLKIVEYCPKRPAKKKAEDETVDLIDHGSENGRRRFSNGDGDRYRAIAEDMPVLVCRFFADGALSFVNRACRQFFNAERRKVLHGSFFDLMAEPGRAPVRPQLEALTPERPTANFERKVVGPDGSARWQQLIVLALFDEKSEIAEYQAIGTDITDKVFARNLQKKMDAQVRQAQKLEAIGTLAGGIAHDFNNILSGVMGYAELALEEIEEGSQAHSDLRQVLAAGRRARDLIRQILNFSRQQKEEIRPLQVFPIVKEAIKFLRASLPATIEIEEKIDTAACYIMSDPVQIQQVMINLCANASQAIGSEKGKIKISLAEIELDGDCDPEIKPGPCLRLSVSDSGQGMTDDVLERIFEPYFTTKATGDGGVGLGLSIVHGIVKRCGGFIRVFSEKGTGSVFDVYFPVVAREKHLEHGPATALFTGPGPQVLFVDDEEPIAKMGERMLRRLGLRVESLFDPSEALEIFSKNPGMFDLVITDLIMPRMTGEELSSKIKKMRPEIPIIALTGFSEKLSEVEARECGIDDVVMKPILLHELAESVRKALEPGSKRKP